MTAEQGRLVERLRAVLASEPRVREVSMFGGRAIMVNEKIIVSVQKDGGLLLRVDARQHEELIRSPGASQARMGHGRGMGPGWIMLAAKAVESDEALASWVKLAMAYNSAA